MEIFLKSDRKGHISTNTTATTISNINYFSLDIQNNNEMTVCNVGGVLFTQAPMQRNEKLVILAVGLYLLMTNHSRLASILSDSKSSYLFHA